MTENPLTLRPVQDEEPLVALNVIEAVLAAYRFTLDDDSRKEISSPDSYRRNGGEFWVLDAQGALAGTVATRPASDGDSTWEIKWLYLMPAWRRIGQGRNMLENALDYAKAHGAKKVVIETHSSFAEAYSLLLSCGFCLEDNTTPDAIQGEFKMICEISAS